jgi:small-conductance mechanosensitive channel
MSVTIATIVQYALTAIAFFLALAATGVELGQLTIIGGALSVGVGFGLQTIVNNFISGLILAFERPVSIGDTIQLDNLEGVVTKIGIRASVIRIPSGADLIIPNGRLLDRDLINWTRSGRNRRIEIPLRVQSGIEPRAIVDLLPTIAARHRDVSQVPPPTCVFKGFGDSSTDFVLACWTFAADHGAVRSEISLQAEEELRKAGYSSPFPQQDLHLRSVSKDVVAAFGNLESATNTPTHIESER